MNIVRLNMSHAQHDWVRKMVAQIRALSESKGMQVGILMDTQGPAIRTGDLPVKLDLKPGDIFTFTVLGAQCDEEYSVNVNYDGLVSDLNVDDVVIVDNGIIRLQVIEKLTNRIRCRVLTEGQMGSRRHINLPGVRVNLPALTEKDLADVALGCELDVDYIALSFCREPKDIVQLRQIVTSKGCNPRIIAKIEDQEAVRNLAGIIEEADAIMCARGDLGIECLLEELPIIQRRIVKNSILRLKPVIVATHMLESMINSPSPTRAEITDVANAVYEQADALMLSGETTTGRYPLACVEIMDRVARRTERSGGVNYAEHAELLKPREKFLNSAISLSNDLKASAIILFTVRGFYAGIASALRPHTTPIYAFTPHIDIARRLTLNRGVYPFVLEFNNNPEVNIQNAEKMLLAQKRIESGNYLVVVTDVLAQTNADQNFAQDRLIEAIQMRVVQ